MDKKSPDESDALYEVPSSNNLKNPLKNKFTRNTDIIQYQLDLSYC